MIQPRKPHLKRDHREMHKPKHLGQLTIRLNSEGWSVDKAIVQERQRGKHPKLGWDLIAFFYSYTMARHFLRALRRQRDYDRTVKRWDRERVLSSVV